MNEQNLKPFKKGEISSEVAKANGSKGGKRASQLRKERKSMREQLDYLMKLPLQNEKAKEQMRRLGINDDDIDNQMALTVSVFNKALANGDIRAYELIRDTLGEKPVEVIQNIEPPTIVLERPKKK